MLSSRVLQGIAGGGFAPVAQSILVDTFPPAKRASAFALYTIVIVTAPAIGPVLGGWITDSYNWRWIFFINIPIGLLALFLSGRVLKDPPAFAAERGENRQAEHRRRRHFADRVVVGGAGTDARPRPDRGLVRQPLHLWMLGIGVVGWIATITWELRLKDPVIDFRLLGNRNFAIAGVLFFIFGFGLFGSTTLIPQMLQSLYGYRAIDAGLVLGPGALVITLFAPIAAQLIQRQLVQPRDSDRGQYDHRRRGDVVLQHLHTGDRPSITFWPARFKGSATASFLSRSNVIAYSQLSPDQNNKASSLTNLFRNWGGSFGIAFITTAAERRAQFHQTNVGAAIGATSQQLTGRINELTNYLITKGFSGPDATAAASAYLYQQLQRQVSLLSFMDCFRVIAWLTLAAVPLLLFVRRFNSAAKAPAAH